MNEEPDALVSYDDMFDSTLYLVSGHRYPFLGALFKVRQGKVGVPMRHPHAVFVNVDPTHVSRGQPIFLCVEVPRIGLFVVSPYTRNPGAVPKSDPNIWPVSLKEVKRMR